MDDAQHWKEPFVDCMKAMKKVAVEKHSEDSKNQKTVKPLESALSGIQNPAEEAYHKKEHQ